LVLVKRVREWTARLAARGHHVAAKLVRSTAKNRFAKTTSTNEIVSQPSRFGDSGGETQARLG
jgi:hypothetical protein